MSRCPKREQIASEQYVTDAMRYAEAARFVGIPEGTLRTMVHKHKIPHRRLSERIVVFSRADLAAWMESCRVPMRES